MKYTSKLVILSFFTLGGCSNSEPGNKILYEIIKASAGQFFFQTIAWTILFAIAGIVSACLFFFMLYAIGGYRWDWKPAKWFRGATLVLMIILFSFFFGSAGFFEGILQGGEKVLVHSKIAKRVYPAVGKTGADLIATIYLAAPSHVRSSGKFTSFPNDKLETFRKGLWELNVPGFFERLDQVGTETFEALAMNLKKQAQKSYPDLREGIGEKMLDWLKDYIQAL